MKIFISCSLTFSEKIMEIKRELEEQGFEVFIPVEAEDMALNPNKIEGHKVDLENGIKTNIMKKNFNEVAKADALLVLNLNKKGIPGYIGSSVLMEMGLAYYLGKKLFLWQDIPHWDEVSWGYEVRLMQPIVLNGDISKIS